VNEIEVESECKNCNHDIRLHKPNCTAKCYDITEEHVCGCKKPQYFGAIVSDKYVGWTELHCNNCSRLIRFLNTLEENIYEIIQDEHILCSNCITIRK
jgi:hypothetical protein